MDALTNSNYDYEWICTNGIGGYALGTRDLINRRKYHGLLIASHEDLKRIHLVSSIEEMFIVDGRSLFIDSNNYNDIIYPDGFRRILNTWVRPFPAFFYDLSENNDGSVTLLKEIFMAHKSNSVLIRYTNFSEADMEFRLRPKFSIRDHHWVNKPGTFDTTVVHVESGVKDGCNFGYLRRENFEFGEVYFFSGKGEIEKEGLIYRSIYYLKEDERGYDAYEDLISPFLFHGLLHKGGTLEIVFSDSGISEGLCDLNSFNAVKDGIIGRFKDFPLPDDYAEYFNIKMFSFHSAINKKDNKNLYNEIKTDRKRNGIFREKDYKQILKLMLEDFLIVDDIIAGYPWFSAWGRDTMISLEAFLIDEKRYLPFILDILNSYGSKMRNGILPNVKGEGGEGENFDTVDASLLYLLRVYEIFESLNKKNREKIFRYVQEVVCNYLFNNKLSFYCDENDYLICIKKDKSRALTWMDAKVDGVAVTPRYGKPVEINGLWYSGLMATIEMATKLGKTKISSSDSSIKVTDLTEIAKTVKNSMKSYFVDNYWLDLIESERKEAEKIRPNFIIALSLPFDFADYQSLKRGYEIAKEKLLTPYGLRSLSMDSPDFRGVYRGDQKIRDFAYHQGTVWTWLLLPYAKLLSKVIPDKDKLKKELISVISSLKDLIKNNVIASIAEIWDGENPKTPKGAPAQAWSVAAVYYIEHLIDGL